MEEDVAKALAYQVKKELAERYFGFRRLIEEDTARYFRAIEQLRQKITQNLRPEFWCLYALLNGEEPVKDLTQALGFKSPPFWEEYLKLSKKEKLALFRGLNPRGLTDKGRFKRLFKAIYQRLYRKAQEYQKALEDLQVEAAVINEEVKRFKAKFDLSEIMQFLKSFEPSADAGLGQLDFKESVNTLEKELELGAVPLPEKLLPAWGPLPSPQEIQDELALRAKEAWRQHKTWAKEIVKSARAEV